MLRPRISPLVSLLAAGLIGALVPMAAPAAPATWCPAGYRPVAAEREISGRQTLHYLADRELDAAVFARATGCVSDKHPESFTEFAAARERFESAAPPGAYRAALGQRQALAEVELPGSGGRWSPYGKGPLISNDPRFGNVNGNGLVDLNGRVDSLDHDPASGRLFAALGTGGVWVSENLGGSWRSIGDALPTQIIGAVAWTPGAGGTVVAVSGEPIMAGLTRTGYGAFYTRDLGATWHQARGVPDEILGMQIAVDPTNPDVVYAATSKGLYRSDDAGASYVNVKLPTGACAGKTDNQSCLLANIVTDVVVQSPDTFGNKGGAVLAVVGYRASNRPYPQHRETIESEDNGLYRSETGKLGTFTKLDVQGFAPQQRIGKTELGVADGRAQNHDYVYAIVEDAVLFRGGYPSIDAPENTWPGLNAVSTVLNGIYVSNDFGQTWTQMADWKEIAFRPDSGSALTGTGQAIQYAPGVQAWYNQFIKVDPTRTTPDGIPTRIVFGLEEVWQNDNTTQPADGKASFHVMGRYFADRTCLFLDTGQSNCPYGRPPVALTTTHPDQHEGLFLPDGKGGVTLFVGNDGGVYKQHVAKDEEFDNTKWGRGANNGFNTLLPYHAQMAKDGTVWFGLQDNGSGKIEPDTRKQYMTFGGDGFWVAVDPDDSNYAWSEVTFGNMRVTTDGGRTWRMSGPIDMGGGQFANPFVMDPTDANHLLTAGNDVMETVDGPNTCPVVIENAGQQVVCTWTKVFDLGSRRHPGDPDAALLEENADVDNLMSAVALHGDAAYVGYCGPCGLINTSQPFTSGIATNVGGPQPPKRSTSDGWHIAAAAGLPHRMITAIAIDPKDPRNVYVTLGGYEHREWRPPGSFKDPNDAIGRGHVFRSTDAGQTFTDVSGDLPNAPALSIVLRANQIIVGTKVGAFISSDLNGSRWALLGEGLPSVLVSSLQVAPQDPNLLMAATFGRGIYTYRFPTSSVLGSRRTVTKPRDLPATGAAGPAAGVVALALAGALGSRLRRSRRMTGS